MSKSNKKNKKYIPEDIVKDINKIVNFLDNFEKTSLESLDLDKFNKDIDKMTEEIDKKYSEGLDSKE